MTAEEYFNHLNDMLMDVYGVNTSSFGSLLAVKLVAILIQTFVLKLGLEELLGKRLEKFYRISRLLCSQKLPVQIHSVFKAFFIPNCFLCSLCQENTIRVIFSHPFVSIAIKYSAISKEYLCTTHSWNSPSIHENGPSRRCS